MFLPGVAVEAVDAADRQGTALADLAGVGCGTPGFRFYRPGARWCGPGDAHVVRSRVSRAHGPGGRRWLAMMASSGVRCPRGFELGRLLREPPGRVGYAWRTPPVLPAPRCWTSCRVSVLITVMERHARTCRLGSTTTDVLCHRRHPSVRHNFHRLAATFSCATFPASPRQAAPRHARPRPAMPRHAMT